MRILAVSDLVLESHYHPDVARRYPKPDLLIGCGDLPFYYLDFLISALDTHMVYVRGNHDGGRHFSTEHGELREVRGGHNIHTRCVRINDVLIAGLEGSLWYRPNVDHTYTQREMALAALSLFPRLLWNRARYGRALDILVTHAPPYRVQDMEDVPHTGFKAFLPLLRWFRPRWLLHGHIHRYRNDLPWQTQYHHTTVINVYPARLLEFSRQTR
jgi:Icc-related predicted phosphoesterase